MPRPQTRVGRSTAVVIGLAALTAFVLLVSGTPFGMAAGTWALGVALFPLPAYLAVVLLMDRFEPEPRWLLAIAFLWGASVAILVSGVLNGLAERLAGEPTSSIALTPIIEEVLKALVILAFAYLKPDEFDGVLDGIVYAAMAGLGFAMMENVEYYGNALLLEGPRGLAVTFTLRGVVSPFSHPLFTAMSGLGIGLARQSSRRALQLAGPPVGLLAAIGLHAAWNAGASAGFVFFFVYGLVMIPLLVGVIAAVLFSLRRESRIIRERLAGEVAVGRLGRDELDSLASVGGRLRETREAWARGGRRSLGALRSYHTAATELAFLRQRAARGGCAPDSDLETRWLSEVWSARRALGRDPEPGGD